MGQGGLERRFRPAVPIAHCLLQCTCLILKLGWAREDSNLRSSPCKGDVIATRPQAHFRMLKEKIIFLFFLFNFRLKTIINLAIGFLKLFFLLFLVVFYVFRVSAQHLYILQLYSFR